MSMVVKMMDQLFPIEISKIENIIFILPISLYLDYLLHIH